MCGRCGLGSFRNNKPPSSSARSAFNLRPEEEHARVAGAETWAVAFSPDGQFFAWSSGYRVVTIVRWDAHKRCFTGLGPRQRLNSRSSTRHDRRTNAPVYEFSEDVGAAGGEEPPDEAAAALPSSGSERPSAPDEAARRQGLEPDEAARRQGLEIHCGDLVHSMAFGSATPDAWHRPLGSRYTFVHVSSLMLATGLANGRIRIWDVTKGSMVFQLCDHTHLVRDVKFAPDGSLQLVSASRDGTIKFWDLTDDGNMYRTLRHPRRGSWVFSVAWSPDAKLLVSVGNERQAMVWSRERLELVGRLEGHHHDVVAADFSPDGALVATASWDTRCLVWDAHTRILLRELWHLFPAPSPLLASGITSHWVRSVQFSHDGAYVATVNDDGYVRFWALDDEDCPQKIGLVEDGLCCCFSPDSTLFAVGTRHGRVEFLDAAPDQLPTLQHLCRVAIRKHCQDVRALYLPTKLKHFLEYRRRHLSFHSHLS